MLVCLVKLYTRCYLVWRVEPYPDGVEDGGVGLFDPGLGGVAGPWGGEEGVGVKDDAAAILKTVVRVQETVQIESSMDLTKED